jgi:hypothetical protein
MQLQVGHILRKILAAFLKDGDKALDHGHRNYPLLNTDKICNDIETTMGRCGYPGHAMKLNDPLIHVWFLHHRSPA